MKHIAYFTIITIFFVHGMVKISDTHFILMQFSTKYSYTSSCIMLLMVFECFMANEF